MRKSSLLHNPKDMLSRSFKPAKLTTSLKLGNSRMKLMKNKKDVQINQMKRELAQLLESGQAQTARIRVEHVIREEKMKAAYELLQIYSELIVSRLPVIESQKACPIDLKEAVTGIIFASPRCGEIPELLDARKQLSTKYGKEFATAAIEMRPNCGVSRLLIEKLSAGAPDLQTKLKALAKIAEEHNIKWDSATMGQIEAPRPDDLLNGPNTFEASGVAHKVHLTPHFHAPPSHDSMDYHPINHSQQNVRLSPLNHDYTPGHDSFSRNSSSSIPQDQMKPSGMKQEKDQGCGESFQREGSSSGSGQSWDMEFKDAASAARAAAESAERATMAAKAAAEFSSRVQDTSRVHNSFGDSRGDQGSRKHGDPTSDYVSQDSVKGNVLEKLPRFQKDQPDVTQQENRNRSSKRSDEDGHTVGNVNTASSRSETSVQDSGQGVQVQAGKLQKNHPREDEIRTESSMQLQSGNFEIKGKDHLRGSFDAENSAYSRVGVIGKQSSGRSANSRSKASASDDDFSNYGIFGNDAGSGSSVGKDARASSYSAADASVTFDDSGSDGEDFGPTSSFSIHKESDLLFASPSRSPPNLHSSRKSPLGSTSEYSQKQQFSAEFSERAEASPRKQPLVEFSERVEASPAHPQEHTFGPVTFDDSDGSESDTDVFMSKHGTVEDVGRQNHYREFSDSQIHRNDSRKSETSGIESLVSSSSSRPGQSQQKLSDAVKDEKKHLISSQLKDRGGSPHSHGEILDDEDSDDGKELNFNLLTGGFRHKGYFRPPYIREVSDAVGASIKQSSAASTNTKAEDLEDNGRSTRVPDSNSDSDSDSPDEEVIQALNLRRKQKDVGDGHKDVNSQTQSRFRGSVTYFDSESEDDSGVQVKTGNSQVGSGISKRMSKASSHVSQRTPANRTHGIETPEEYLQRNRNSDQRRKSEHATKEKSKPSVFQPPASIEDDSSKNRPSHVHPKLPDFDSLAARLDAIRMNRQ